MSRPVPSEGASPTLPDQIKHLAQLAAQTIGGRPSSRAAFADIGRRYAGQFVAYYFAVAEPGGQTPVVFASAGTRQELEDVLRDRPAPDGVRLRLWYVPDGPRLSPRVTPAG